MLCGDDYAKDCHAHVLFENLENCVQNFAIKMACSVPPPKFTVLLKGESLSGVMLLDPSRDWVEIVVRLRSPVVNIPVCGAG